MPPSNKSSIAFFKHCTFRPKWHSLLASSVQCLQWRRLYSAVPTSDSCCPNDTQEELGYNRMFAIWYFMISISSSTQVNLSNFHHHFDGMVQTRVPLAPASTMFFAQSSLNVVRPTLNPTFSSRNCLWVGRNTCTSSCDSHLPTGLTRVVRVDWIIKRQGTHGHPSLHSWSQKGRGAWDLVLV